MMGKIMVGIMAFLVLVVSAGLIQKAMAQDPSQMSSAQPVDVGNKYCPVSGRPIGVMGPGVEQEYNGKIYHLCCGGCIATFNSDPVKYSKIAEARNIEP
jgi:YHS domain-containing protein